MPVSQDFFFAIILTIGCGIYLVRQTLLSPGSFDKYKDSGDNDVEPERGLSPVEVAYLRRDGDGGFALIVLLFDIMHREVKDKITGGDIEKFDSHQRTYELALKKAAGGSIKDWSLRKVGALTKVGRADPVKFVVRLPALYKMMRTVVEETVHDIFRDPRNIKKFFSVPGLLRLAADIGTTGYKAKLEEELKDELTEAGYLATDLTRHKTIKLLLTTCALSQIVLLTLILLTIPSHLHACIIYFCAVFAAFVVQACTGAREFIPLYSDLSRALAQVKGANFRITILRACLTLVTLILNVLSLVVFIIIFGSGSLFLYLTHTVTSIVSYLMLVALMLVELEAFSYLIEAYKLSLGQMPTKWAKHCLEGLQRKYRQEETLPSLKALLSQEDYSPDLSYLIAIYGLETLFLI